MVLLSEVMGNRCGRPPNGFAIRARWKQTYGMSPKKSKINRTKRKKKEPLYTLKILNFFYIVKIILCLLWFVLPDVFDVRKIITNSRETSKTVKKLAAKH